MAKAPKSPFDRWSQHGHLNRPNHPYNLPKSRASAVFSGRVTSLLPPRPYFDRSLVGVVYACIDCRHGVNWSDGKVYLRWRNCVAGEILRPDLQCDYTKIAPGLAKSGSITAENLRILVSCRWTTTRDEPMVMHPTQRNPLPDGQTMPLLMG